MKKTIVLVAAALMLALLAAGCKNDDKAAADAAAGALQGLYACSAEEKTEFESVLADSAENESALKEYARKRAKTEISDAAIENVLDNRLLTRSMMEWPDQAVRVLKIRLEPVKNQAEKQRSYQYKLVASPESGEVEKEFTGIVVVAEKDGKWLVDKIQ